MQTLLANLTGTVRRETLNGRDYLVAPLTMIVPGVLNGSRGPLLYPLEEVSREPTAWNGMPIVLDHPSDDGQPVSARTPNVLANAKLGEVFNTTANGKLTAEGWFDVELTRNRALPILQQLQAGKQIELSTGLALDVEDVTGVHNTEDGRKIDYRGIARNYRPDHLAVFIGKRGACSVDDGCGVNNEDKQTLWNRLGQLLGISSVNNASTLPGKGGKPAMEDGEDEEETENKLDEEKKMATKNELIDGLIANCDCWTENDRETLDKLPEDKLKAMNEGAERSKLVHAAVEKGLQVGNAQYTLNAEGEWEKREQPASNEGGDDKKTDTANERQIKLEDLPPEMQSVYNHGREMLDRERGELIGRLTANKEGEELKKVQEIYNRLSLEELRSIAPQAPTANDDQPRAPFYVGGAPVDNAGGLKKPEPIPDVTWNFDEVQEPVTA